MPDSIMNNPSILVVEDEAIVAADIALKLERLGYSVPETAASADEAMELAERLKPALVLMDIHLHGSTDGIEAARAIQARQDVPVIFLSGSSDSDTLKRVISSGPTGFILKPFEERDMVAQVELALYKHRADQILREKEQRYRTLFQENRAVLLLIDPLTGSIANANPAACRYYGYTLEEITALNISDINTLPFDRIAEKIESITSEQGGHFYFQHRLADGRIRDVEVFSGMVVDSGRDRIYSIVHDITDHKRAQESLRQLNDSLERQVDERTQLAESRAAQLQTLAVELLQAEEHERQRLADMLHNDQQQIIAAARMKVQGLMEKLPGMSEMSEVVHMLTQSIDSLRALSFELNPIGLQKGRLIEGLEWLGKDMRKRFGLRVTLQADSDDMILNIALKRFIFRAVQELLFNVVKHAETREARVEVVEQENNISIAVSDQGKGFDTAILENSAKPDGLGLLSLRERIRHIDGSFAIDSVPGEGCRIDLKIPLMMLKKADFECLRQKATQMIRHVSETPHGNDSGLLKVLHELEVQHVELEIQNQELHRTMKELEQSQNVFSHFYLSAPLALVTLDEHFVIQQLNNAAANLFSIPRHLAIKSSFWRLIPDNQLSRYHTYLRDVKNNCAPAFCELRLKGGDSEQRHVYLTACSQRDKQGKIVQWHFFIIDVHALDKGYTA